MVAQISKRVRVVDSPVRMANEFAPCSAAVLLHWTEHDLDGAVFPYSSATSSKRQTSSPKKLSSDFSTGSRTFDTEAAPYQNVCRKRAAEENPLVSHTSTLLVSSEG